MRSLTLKKTISSHRLALLAVLSCTAVACNDGPNQTYAPPAPNANWNDGRANLGDAGSPLGTATNATAPFTNDGGAIGTGGTNASEVCSQSQIATQNPIIDKGPIIPPNVAANLNLAGLNPDGTVSWQGLTIEQAEAINCQGENMADLFGTLTDLSVGWVNDAVVVEYSIATQKLDYIGVGPGLYGGQYLGTMTMTSPDGSTTYVVAVDGTTPITETVAGSPSTTLSLDWVDAKAGDPVAMAPFDNMYRAAIATFLPGFPAEPNGTLCNQTGACVIGLFPAGAYAYFFIPALGVAMWVNPYYTPANANAINRMDIDFAQIMNFSPANPVLVDSAIGPTTIPLQIAQPGTPPCQLLLGMDYNTFSQDCVLTSASTTANATEQAELFANISHDEETYQFNITGVDMSFADTHLGQTQTVIDPPATGCPMGAAVTPGCPQTGDVGIELNVDQSTLSNIANDWIYNSSGVAVTNDLHGIGALYDDYRTIAVTQLESEICAGVVVGGSTGSTGSVGSIGTTGAASTTSGAAGTTGAASTTSGAASTTSGTTSSGGGGGAPAGPFQFPAQANCAYWQATPLAAQIANCVAPRGADGNLLNPIGSFAPVGCTGLENMISSDITTPDDPVNVGPIVTQINANLSLGMKMGHQQASFCADSMSRNQIAETSFVVTCAGGAASCPNPATDASWAGCPPGTCDPSGGACPSGTPTCTNTEATNTVPLTVAQVDAIGELGPATWQLTQAPGTEVVLNLPQACNSGDILPTSHTLAIGNLAAGNVSDMPVDIRDNRFFFKMYGYSIIQTLEATAQDGSISAPVATWGPPTMGSLEPVQINDLFFDSNGDGQFETMEYVDRRFVCPDGAQNCAPAGSTGFTCPTGGTTTCNAGETAQPPLDISFNADVKDGIQNAYDINRYLYRGESALYQMIEPAGFAPAQASNALFSAIFGSALINALGGLPPGLNDLTGVPINPDDYASALSGTPLTLSFGQAPSSPLIIMQTFQGAQQALVNYPNANDPTGSSTTLIPWIPNQPGNGFSEANPGDTALDYFVQSASIDFTGITTSALLDYNLLPNPTAADPNAVGMEELAVESTNFLGDVFMCYEPAANPPLLAIRMYTPTEAVLAWLNQVPSAYADCGIVVRWSPFGNFVNLIESTTYGVRLNVTQGGGLGRVVGAQLYVPGVPFQE